MLVTSVTSDKTVKPVIRRGELNSGTKDVLAVAKFGTALTLTLGSLLGVLTYAEMRKPLTPRAIEYGPAERLIGADINNDGLLARQEALDYITRNFGLTPEGVVKAKEFGIQASKHVPTHGSVFLKTVEELQQVLDNKEK